MGVTTPFELDARSRIEEAFRCSWSTLKRREADHQLAGFLAWTTAIVEVNGKSAWRLLGLVLEYFIDQDFKPSELKSSNGLAAIEAVSIAKTTEE